MVIEQDPEFAEAGRDTLYYVRALQAATPTINGEQLRCEWGEDGECIAVQPCHAGAPTALEDDCLSDQEERAWSSPIFVDYEEGALPPSGDLPGG